MSSKSLFCLGTLLRARRTLMAIVVLLLHTGCAHREELPGHRQMTPLPPGAVCRVAVLPFSNDSEFSRGGVIVEKIFMAELERAGDYQVLQEGDILKVYRQLWIYPGREPDLEELRIIADRLNAQLLVTGIVMEMREDPGPNSTTIPKVVMEVQLRDGRNGETLWTAYHHRLGSDYTKTLHFGTIHSVAGLARQMVVEIINLWFEKGLPQCNVLSQQ